MSFQTPLTIKKAITNIHERKYLLPAIQREFVWNNEQIERLFDSLMRGYPISSFLFWRVDRKNNQAFQFYEFIREYHERDRKHNTRANVKGEDEVMAILDGQQRLTALYIGLKGSYADKLPKLHWKNDLAFPERKLYLNLLSTSDDNDLMYDFRFLTSDDRLLDSIEAHWFEVGKILDLEAHDVNGYLVKNKLVSGHIPDNKAEFASRVLFQLHTVIHTQPTINYFLEEDESLDKVLNIFIRVNSGGTVLSYSDLLLSIATAKWSGQDQSARQIITDFVDELNRYGDGFNFNKDLVLKSCLVLNDITDIAFKVDNFQQENMRIIEQKWNDVSNALRLAVKLISSYGFSRENLTSNNAIIPIAYYLIKNNNPDKFDEKAKYSHDRQLIQKWLIRSLLKRVFSGASDTFLSQVRRIIASSSNGFPLNQVTEEFRGETKSIIFSNEEIEHLFSYEYGKSYTFSALVLLYPSLDLRNKFHQDHIFPKSHFKPRQLSNYGISSDKIDRYMESFNHLANLQLLEGTPNQEKSNKDFKSWLYEMYPDSTNRREFMRLHYIPEHVDLSLDNFEEFIAERIKLMTSKFIAILQD